MNQIELEQVLFTLKVRKRNFWEELKVCRDVKRRKILQTQICEIDNCICLLSKPHYLQTWYRWACDAFNLLHIDNI